MDISEAQLRTSLLIISKRKKKNNVVGRALCFLGEGGWGVTVLSRSRAAVEWEDATQSFSLFKAPSGTNLGKRSVADTMAVIWPCGTPMDFPVACGLNLGRITRGIIGTCRWKGGPLTPQTQSAAEKSTYIPAMTHAARDTLSSAAAELLRLVRARPGSVGLPERQQGTKKGQVLEFSC